MASMGKQIQGIRRKKGLSQEELAQAIGSTKSAISRYESGKRQPRLEQLQRIASALDVPIYELLGLIDEGDGLFSARLSDDLVKALGLDSLQEDEYAVGTIDPTSGFAKALAQSLWGASTKERLESAFERLNEEGQQKAVERVEELTEIPKYQRKKDSTDDQTVKDADGPSDND